MTRREVEFAIPPEVTFPLDGEDVTVRAANVRQCLQMLGACEPLLDELLLIPAATWARLFPEPTPENPAPATQATALDLSELLRLLNSHGDAVTRLVAIAADLPEERVARLMPDQFAFLFAVMVEVNRDFFGRAGGSFRKAAEVLRAATGAPAAGTPGGA